MKINTNLIAAAIVSGIVTGACGQSQNRPPGFGNLAVPVELTKVETATIKDSSIFLGMLEAQARVTLQPEVAGRIVNISAKSGQRVTRGEPIAQLRPDLDRARLDSAIANANALRAAQEAARSNQAIVVISLVVLVLFLVMTADLPQTICDILSHKCRFQLKLLLPDQYRRGERSF